MEKKQPHMVFGLAFMGGLYSLCFIGEINRELMARFGGALEASACGLLLLMCWFIVGSISLRLRPYPIVTNVAATAMLPLSSIIGIVITAWLPALGKACDMSTVIVTAGAGTLLVGLNGGIAYTLSRGRVKQNNYIGWLTGAIAGGVAYQFRNKLPIAEVGLLLSSAIVLLIAVFIKYCSGRMRIYFAVVTLAILFMTGWLLTDWNLFQHHNSQVGTWIKSIDYPDGRYSMVIEPNRRHGEFLLFKNCQALWRIPEGAANYSAIALFSAMQHKSDKRQKVLLISSPFTKVPYLMLGFPNIASIDLLCYNRDLALLAISSGILPAVSQKFNIIINNRTFHSSWVARPSNAKYDLIIVLDNAFSRLFTPYFFGQVKSLLAANGVVTVGLHRQRMQADKLISNLRAIFTNVKVINADPILIAGGEDEITVSLAELDARCSVNSNLPAGSMAALYSVLENIAVPQDDPSTPSPRIFIVPELPWNSYLSVAIILLFYCVLKFFMSRRNNRAVMFTAGENGFYAMGMLLTATLYFQTYTDELYGRGVLLIAMVIVGMMLGFLICRQCFRLGFIVTVLSVILPGLLFILNTSVVARWPIELTITALLLLTGLVTGCGHIMSRQKATLLNHHWLPIFELVGGSLAICCALLHRMFGLHLWTIIIALAVLRLVTVASLQQFRMKNSSHTFY